MKSNLLDRLNEGFLVGDGAMGTLLYERGLSLDRCCEELILRQPDLIRKVHADYLDAGAQVIETNTFGANSLKLARHGLEKRVREISQAAVRVAQEAVGNQEAWIAGSVGPSGISMEEARIQEVNLTEIFREQIQALVEAGVDLLMLETFSDLEELKLALQVAKRAGAVPVLASLSFNENGMTYRGHSMASAFQKLAESSANIVGANCCVGPRVLAGLYRAQSPQPAGIPCSAFPNAGQPEFQDGRYYYLTTPTYFAGQGVELFRQGVKLVGGCCGTGPEHIRELRKALDHSDLNPAAVSTVPKAETRIRAPIPPATPPAGKPNLVEMLRQKTVIITEFDSPKTLVLDKMLEAARALKAAGTDFLTVADNSLAILRMSCVTTAHLVERETGLRSIVHLACRDRNLIGTQSELMGMHALGLDHVLALTGDPSKVGDTPGAANVYDLNSISLLEGIRAMNEGRSFGGRDLKCQARFTAGASFNPNVKNIDIQIKRLERKVAAGARFVMTQPVFDPALVKITHDATCGFGIPVFVGVMPLLNARNTEFLHNEVPGIVIPDPIRSRMRGKEADAGFQEGVKIARELAGEVLKHFKGIYLITPLVKYEATAELSRAIRDGKV